MAGALELLPFQALHALGLAALPAVTASLFVILEVHPPLTREKESPAIYLYLISRMAAVLCQPMLRSTGQRGQAARAPPGRSET